MFRAKLKPTKYQKRFSRLSNSTKKINKKPLTSQRGGIKL